MSRFIQKQLNDYADCLELKEELVHDALCEMDSLLFTRQNTKPSRGGIYRRVLAFCSCVALIFLSVYLLSQRYSLLAPDGDNNAQPPTSYSLFELKRTPISQSQIKSTQGVRYIDIDEDDKFYLKEAFMFLDKSSGEVLVVSLKYTAIRNGFVDEIIIVSDIKGNLSDFEGEFSSATVDKYYDVYIDGEYYSALSYKTDIQKYYMFIMSPQTQALIEYESFVLDI